MNLKILFPIMMIVVASGLAMMCHNMIKVNLSIGNKKGARGMVMCKRLNIVVVMAEVVVLILELV